MARATASVAATATMPTVLGKSGGPGSGRRRAERTRPQHELALAQRQDLAPHQACHVHPHVTPMITVMDASDGRTKAARAAA